MFKLNMDDTIAAVSTPIGEGGIGIVRLSGKESLTIADKIFLPKNGTRPSQFPTYTTHYGHIIDGRRSPVTGHRSNIKDRRQATGLCSLGYDRRQIIDEVILTVMRAPKSYTKENVVEINCHGGIISLRKVLDVVVGLGARLAEPGEFTKRAFLNGRLDLAQAEAVLDVVRAKTDVVLRTALEQLEGGLSSEVRKMREDILDIYAHIEASIDFPEQDIDILASGNLLNRIEKIKGSLGQLLDTADSGMVLREGLTTVISGKPNVGKSSLLNALLRQNRAIVTPIPGTTRDSIEEIVNIEGIPLKIIDTAGIIETEDLVEREGANRSRRYLDRADLILLVLDGSRELSHEDKEIMSQLKHKKVIVIINKIDLRQNIDLAQLSGLWGEDWLREAIHISATERTGLPLLEKTIKEMVWRGEAVSSHGALITNVRHRDAARRAFDCMVRVVESIEQAMSAEFIAIDLKEALDNLGEIVGETITEDLLDKIFSEFCIGK